MTGQPMRAPQPGSVTFSGLSKPGAVRPVAQGRNFLVGETATNDSTFNINEGQRATPVNEDIKYQKWVEGQLASGELSTEGVASLNQELELRKKEVAPVVNNSSNETAPSIIDPELTHGALAKLEKVKANRKGFFTRLGERMGIAPERMEQVGVKVSRAMDAYNNREPKTKLAIGLSLCAIGIIGGVGGAPLLASAVGGIRLGIKVASTKAMYDGLSGMLDKRYAAMGNVSETRRKIMKLGALTTAGLVNFAGADAINNILTETGAFDKLKSASDWAEGLLTGQPEKVSAGDSLTPGEGLASTGENYSNEQREAITSYQNQNYSHEAKEALKNPNFSNEAAAFQNGGNFASYYNENFGNEGNSSTVTTQSTPLSQESINKQPISVPTEMMADGFGEDAKPSSPNLLAENDPLTKDLEVLPQADQVSVESSASIVAPTSQTEDLSFVNETVPFPNEPLEPVPATDTMARTETLSASPAENKISFAAPESPSPRDIENLSVLNTVIKGESFNAAINPAAAEIQKAQSIFGLGDGAKVKESFLAVLNNNPSVTVDGLLAADTTALSKVESSSLKEAQGVLRRILPEAELAQSEVRGSSVVSVLQNNFEA